MKKIFLFTFLSLLLFSCEDDKATKPAPSSDNVESQEAPAVEILDDKNDPANFATTNQKETIAKNSPIVGRPGGPISKQTRTVIDAFCTDMWEMAAYVHMSIPKEERMKKNLKNRGRWFKFSSDGTFVSGQFDQETGSGKWFYDPMGPLVYLENKGERDEEYTIKMNSDETTMIWIGTKTFNESGAQAKIENTSDFPRKRG